MAAAAARTQNAMPEWIQSGPHPHVEGSRVEFPRRHVLLVTLDRPAAMNCLTIGASVELGSLWKWYDGEPGLRCAVVTGAGDRAFCAGMDLKERLEVTRSRGVPREFPSGGFAGMSNRTGKKPIIAAVNGLAHGGGMETVMNADVVFACPEAEFRLPEILRGLAALAGALPRCMALFGRQRTMDLALTGRPLGAAEAASWGLVKEVVPSRGHLLPRALDYASGIASQSPDGVIVARLAALEAWEAGSVSRATSRAQEVYAEALMRGANAAEGLAAFREKRDPKWLPSQL